MSAPELAKFSLDLRGDTRTLTFLLQDRRVLDIDRIAKRLDTILE